MKTKKQKKVAVSSSKGGVGKTTIAINMAAALEKLGHSVSVFDFDRDNKNSLKANERRVNHPLSPLPPLDVVLIDNETELAAALDSCTSDFIIFDTSGADTAANRDAMLCADIIICPIKDGANEIAGFEEFAKILRAIGSPKIHMLCSPISARSFDFEGLQMLANGYYKECVWMESKIRFLAAFDRALFYGRGVVEFSAKYYAKAADDITACVDEILRIVK